MALLESIKVVKRESRMARDNSEDATTWNVFRFLERTGMLPGLLSSVVGREATNPRVIYWSYDQGRHGVWKPLGLARAEFGERDQCGSEPDLIIVCDQALVWVEAKVTALNETLPSNPGYSLPAYSFAGDGWFQHVFDSDAATIALSEKLYELMRFWLLGSWISSQCGKQFHLISLVLDRQEPDLVGRVAPHLKQQQDRSFARLTWEQIYLYVCAAAEPDWARERLLGYFENKTVGYRAGALQAAFSTPHYR
jgi:hypothetical protein